MMLTNTQIWQRLQQIGVNKTLTEIDVALAQIDQQVIFNQERARFRIEMWDKVSPINGVPAEKILAREDVPANGEVYLAYLDGRLTYLQPHDPFQAGIVPMTPDTVLQIANRHIDQMATQFADQKVVESVLAKLLA